MLPHRFRLHTLAATMACLFCHAPVWADTPSTGEAAKLQDIEVKARRLSTDQQGEARQFRDNVSNEYIGKEELERFKVNAAGDVLKGLNGVYNMNTRTAGGAITPNIRGLSGKGRIPVTLDGTEQTVDVWMNNYGVGERNYLDPALFRSIVVEKSPALTRGVKSGVGGAVAIRTIEPEDLIPEGKKWGVQVKADFSNNSVKPRDNLNQYLGWEDYRTLPFNATADGSGDAAPIITGYWPYFRELNIDKVAQPRGPGENKALNFKDDKAFMVGAAFKTDVADGLAAYAYRNKGNYFAGKRGASGYRNNPNEHWNACYINGGNDSRCMGSANFYPNMTRLFPAKTEAINSNTESRTLLLKNNWYLPDNHKIGLQYMRTDIGFGEINPIVMKLVLDNAEHNPEYNDDRFTRQQQGIDSKIRTDVYKLGWNWKPENSRWIDLDTNLWHIKTNSTRYQSGGMTLAVRDRDYQFDYWLWCTQRGQLPPYMVDDPNYNPNNDTCATHPDIAPHLHKTREQLIAETPNTDGGFAVFSGAEQKTRVTRTGFDISNRFRLTPTLSMTWSADYQREKLDDSNLVARSNDFIDLRYMLTAMNYLAGPRGGKRREWGSNLVFDWQATDRLKISAGVRYHNFKALDTALAAGRARRDPNYAAGGEYGSYRAGSYLPYFELVGKEEADSWKQVQATRIEALKRQDAGQDASREWTEYQRIFDAHAQKYQMAKYMDIGYREDIYHILNTEGKTASKDGYTDLSHAVYRVRPVFIPYQNGKLDSSAFDRTYGSVKFGEQVADAQGTGRTYQRYLGRLPGNLWDGDKCANPSCTDDPHALTRAN